MLRKIISIFFILVILVPVNAQKQNDKKRFSPKEFDAQLEQFIVKVACLTPKEASKFFPVYREMMEKQRSLHNEMRKCKGVKPSSDSECKRAVERIDKLEIEIKQIQHKYHTKFFQILPASKVYDVINAEDRFYRQAFKRMADKRRGGR